MRAVGSINLFDQPAPDVARPAEPGRTALLDAGRRLVAEGMPLSRLSANAVVAEASLSKGAFFQHFPRKRDYLIELHRQFHDALLFELEVRIGPMEPGVERLRRGVACYLDFCLDHATTKAFLFDARADGDLADVVSERNEQFARVVAEDLTAMGWVQALEVARLVVASVAEVALIEQSLVRRNPSQRGALAALIGFDRS